MREIGNNIHNNPVLDQFIRAIRPGWIRRYGPHFLTKFERFGPLKLVQIPPNRQLSIVAPHPDDESIGCGGLAAAWSRQEAPVEVIFLTGGELGSHAARDTNASTTERKFASQEIAKIRRAEASAALQDLKANGIWLDGTDGSLFADQDRLVERLSEHWSKTVPDVVAAPFPGDRHRDHAFAAAIVAKAAMNVLAPETIIFGYEVWSPAPVNSVLDITLVAEKKWHAIAQHKSQVATTDYVAASKALATYRAISSGQKGGYAEAYCQQTVKEYARLVDRMKV